MNPYESPSPTPAASDDPVASETLDFPGGWITPVVASVVAASAQYGLVFIGTFGELTPWLLCVPPVLAPAVCAALLPGSSFERQSRSLAGGALALVGLFIYVPVCIVATVPAVPYPKDPGPLRLVYGAAAWAILMYAYTATIACGFVRRAARRRPS